MRLVEVLAWSTLGLLLLAFCGVLIPYLARLHAGIVSDRCDRDIATACFRDPDLDKVREHYRDVEVGRVAEMRNERNYAFVRNRGRGWNS
jgi:hypothetical protein